MPKGYHLGHSKTRYYQEAYSRIKAIWFKELIDKKDGDYSYKHNQLTDEQTKFTLCTGNEYPKVMLYEIEGRKTPVPMFQESVSASTKTYLACPYCLRPCQHLLATKTTFICRTCLGVHYASQSESKGTRMMRKIRKTRRKLVGYFPDIDDLFDSAAWYPKPRNKHHEKFQRELNELVEYEKKYWKLMRKQYGSWFSI